MSIKKTDVDAIAQGYLRDRVNANINPYHSTWAPANTNTSYLQTLTGSPNEAVPSARGWVNGVIQGSQVRNSAINLGNYYARIARGAYGMHGAGSTYSYGSSAYLAFAASDYDATWLNGSLTSFTVPLRIETVYARVVSARIGGRVAANNIRLEGWVSGKRYNNSSWYNIVRKNNKTVFGQVQFVTGNSGMRGVVLGVNFRTAERNNEVAFFAVKDNAPLTTGGTKIDHSNSVRNSIASMWTPTGNITYSHVTGLYDHAWNVINNNRSNITVDLTVCHNSASSGGGHSSRGRR